MLFQRIRHVSDILATEATEGRLSISYQSCRLICSKHIWWPKKLAPCSSGTLTAIPKVSNFVMLSKCYCSCMGTEYRMKNKLRPTHKTHKTVNMIKSSTIVHERINMGAETFLQKSDKRTFKIA